MNNIELALLVVLVTPLIGAIINALISRTHFRNCAPFIGCVALMISTLSSCIIFINYGLAKNHDARFYYPLFTWISVGNLDVIFGLLVDKMSSVMLFMVHFISMLVHIFSVGYMEDDPAKARYFACINLFVFSMTGLILADHLLVMFVFWEGVGLCSYLLIGHWFEKESAAKAGMKAFVVNRVGDFGFVLGLFFIFIHVGSLNIEQVIQFFQVHQPRWLIIAGLCLLLGASGKSAQIPLFVWLPDAMEGPTPVSALIHAATMVTAGIYMIARIFVVFLPIQEIIMILGVSTALVAACIATVQYDLKKILAYSTVSQLGYMVAGLGAGVPETAMFHLLTHAFFKALLFLASGSVMHATHGNLDIRDFGGLRKKMPITAWTMVLGAVALSGFPPFSGFWSKDAIVLSQFSAHYPIGGTLLIITGAITAYYSLRLVLLTFFGKERNQKVTAHVHDGGFLMNTVLIILSIGAVFLGYAYHIYPLITEHDVCYTMGEAHHSNSVMFWAIVASMIGIMVSLIEFRSVEKRGSIKEPNKLQIIFVNRFYFDDFYDHVIVKGLSWVSRRCYSVIDLKIINAFFMGWGPACQRVGMSFSKIHHARLKDYFLLIAWIFIFLMSALLIWRLKA